MNIISDILQEYQTVAEKPESFLSYNDSNYHKIQSLLKQSYDFTKNSEEKKRESLPELIVNNFDLEQIWQQIELQNTDLLKNSLENITRFVVRKSKLVFNEFEKESGQHAVDTETISEENIPQQQYSSDEDNDESSDESLGPDKLNLSEDDEDIKIDDVKDESDENDAHEDTNENKRKRTRPSIVDDDFFKLDEMEDFLNAEEKRLNDQEKDSGKDSESDEDNVDNDEIDFFAAMSGDEDDYDADSKEERALRNPRYKDFFVEKDDYSQREAKRNKFLEEQQAMQDDGVAEEKSTLELREERLQKKIGHLERAALSEKPWQLKGEIKADNRPQNSLLEDVLEFDLSTRPAPVITEQTTLLLEDVIRQRIKDKVFDSVVRKVRPTENVQEYKKKLVLNQEKSKESLSQIYEKEYLQQKDALDPESAEKEEEEPPLHIEVRGMMQKLFSKLDALSNFHFTPRIVAPELKIVSNIPAINMEEVAPVSTSDATLLAPEEVQRKTRGELLSKDERTSTDKKRERRRKKLKQHIHASKKVLDEAKPKFNGKTGKGNNQKLVEQVTKNRNVEKMNENANSKGVKSSTAFFAQLQDEVKSTIKNKATKKAGNEKKSKFSAKRMKL